MTGHPSPVWPWEGFTSHQECADHELRKHRPTFVPRAGLPSTSRAGAFSCRTGSAPPCLRLAITDVDTAAPTSEPRAQPQGKRKQVAYLTQRVIQNGSTADGGLPDPPERVAGQPSLKMRQPVLCFRRPQMRQDCLKRCRGEMICDPGGGRSRDVAKPSRRLLRSHDCHLRFSAPGKANYGVPEFGHPGRR